MVRKSLTGFAKKELNTIHGYSRRHNKLLNRNHSRALLDMMKEHVTEIKWRYSRSDKHYLVETGDLLIICLGLIRQARRSPDVILDRCYGRFHKKLPRLIADLKVRRNSAKRTANSR